MDAIKRYSTKHVPHSHQSSNGLEMQNEENFSNSSSYKGFSA